MTTGYSDEYVTQILLKAEALMVHVHRLTEETQALALQSEELIRSLKEMHSKTIACRVIARDINDRGQD